MYITGPAVGQATKPGNTSTSTGASDGINGLDSTFTTLLVAQLKSQDPLNPMDPTQFVSQLVGLNTLDAVSQIYQLLEAEAAAGSTTSSSASAGGK